MMGRKRLELAIGGKAARVLRGLVACGVFAGCVAGPGCGEEFDSSGQLKTLRVLAVQASDPYPKPGSTVDLNMLWYDGKSEPDQPRAVQFMWIGGCFNPSGDLYYGCYPQLAKLFAEMQANPGPSKYISVAGPTFKLEIPSDIISGRPVTEGVEPYGLSFVFFVVCAGKIGPVPNPAEDVFPLGCFDDQGKQLGADDFVPGYFRMYSFNDRTNANPVLDAFTVNGVAMTEDADVPMTGGAKVQLKGVVNPSSAEQDPSSAGPNGEVLTEQMWIDYYVSGGKLDKVARLVNDATKGWNPDTQVDFTLPAPGERVRVFAVAHDNRGGLSWKIGTIVTQ